jgi:Ca2+/Na+ antiporter
MQVWEALRSERRRDFALGSVIGGGLLMTVLVFLITWFLRDANAVYMFNIAVGALINIAIIFTGILGLLVKRRLSVSRSELSVSDFDENANQPSERNERPNSGEPT